MGGDARGSHVMPLMPVPLNTPVTGMYCLPIVSCAGFSIDGKGRFSESYTDFFDNPAWDEVRRRAQRKAIEMRSQGGSGAANAALFRARIWRLPRHRVCTAEAISAARGAQAGSGRVENAKA